ncbi:DUF2637 domain-containing protein [Micromonospora coerulea]|uniref:DUF2637 domain-containing protein n=1 Tax=Micromonospora coerulea TaxID=47856 RepID=UPI001F40D885|nr:DUF2637 domain-containing protein [Micromonospora veneta]
MSEPTHRPTRAERAESVVLVAILLVVGLAAGAASFSHVHDWTMTNSPAGTPDWFGWANACISELVPVAALLDIRRRRRASKPAGYPLALLVAAAGLSLSAQLAVAKPGLSGGLLSAVPALAFMALVKLVFSSSPATVADTATPERGVHVADVTPAPVADLSPAASVAPVPDRPATPPRLPSRLSSADTISDAASAPGATPASVAAVLGVSVRTAQRHWPRQSVATSPALVVAAA